MVEMNELPEYSKDKAVIRILQHRTWPLMDVDTNENFLRRKFNEHWEKTQAKKNKKSKSDTTKQQKIGVVNEEFMEGQSTSKKIDMKKLHQ